MKKNILLSTLGLLSILGGILAFKAQHRFGGRLLCYTTVGILISGSSGLKIYRAVLTTRYTTNVFVKTLFCTLPAAGNNYGPIRVSADL